MLIVDEPEQHLHPKSQRTVIAKLRQIAEIATEGHPLQLIINTNSPIVLAAAEPDFDHNRDRLWVIDRIQGERAPTATHRDLTPQGGVGDWLKSPALGLPTDRPRSTH